MSERPELGQTRLSDEEQEKLVAYLDGELDDATERQVVAELGLRPEVKREVESLRKTWELLDFLPRPAPTAQFTERTIQKLQVSRVLAAKREQWWRRFAVAGWIFTLALVGAIGFTVAYHWPGRDRLFGGETKPQPTPSASEGWKPEPIPEGLRDDERLMRVLRQDIGRVLNELQPHLQPYEREALNQARRRGGLIFMEELLTLTGKYKVPLQRPLPPGGPPPNPSLREEPQKGLSPKKPPKPTTTKGAE